LGGGGAGVVVERLERDLSSLSEADKARLLDAEAPELAALLDDFKLSVSEVRDRLEPLHAQVRARQLPTSSGVALLQLKLQLLLSYCTNIAFYLLLKANGKTVRDHPVVASLLRHRVLIDRLAPLDKKMRYRVQKLLRTAADGTSAAAPPASGCGGAGPEAPFSSPGWSKG
jgi:U3 small nucleolar RNA-associated protein 3